MSACMMAGSIQPVTVAAKDAANLALNKSATVGFAEDIAGMSPENTLSPASKAVDMEFIIMQIHMQHGTMHTKVLQMQDALRSISKWI